MSLEQAEIEKENWSLSSIWKVNSGSGSALGLQIGRKPSWFIAA